MRIVLANCLSHGLSHVSAPRLASLGRRGAHRARFLGDLGALRLVVLVVVAGDDYVVDLGNVRNELLESMQGTVACNMWPHFPASPGAKSQKVQGREQGEVIRWVVHVSKRVINKHTLSTILHSCVASSNCCLFEIKGSITKCSLISAAVLAYVLSDDGDSAGCRADVATAWGCKRRKGRCVSVTREDNDLPLLPVCMQSTPNLVFFSLAWRDLMLASVSMGLRPEFSARAMGTESRASAKARMAYCSRPGLCERVSVVVEVRRA